MRNYEIYEMMKAKHLTTSMRGWSRAWCGRSQNYCATFRDYPLSPEIGVRIWRGLIRHDEFELAAIVLFAILGKASHPEVESWT